jgi:single-strand DNA-binding protein
MFNRVILVGNLTRDPELRYMPSGGAVCSTGIATNRRFKKQDGTQGEEVCFVDITFFGRTAEIANQYLGKGKKVLVEGRLKLDQWTDQNGIKKSKHSIIVDNMQMLDNRPQGNEGHTDMYHSSSSDMPNYRQNNAEPSGAQIPDIDIDDDEIPF